MTRLAHLSVLVIAAIVVSFTMTVDHAHAQSIWNSKYIDGSIVTVNQDWAHVPPDLGPGDTFRLMFATCCDQFDSSSLGGYRGTLIVDITSNDNHDISDDDANFYTPVLATSFNPVIQDNTASGFDVGSNADQGPPIYWIDGKRIADNYADFYDGTWDTGVHDIKDLSGNRPISETNYIASSQGHPTLRPHFPYSSSTYVTGAGGDPIESDAYGTSGCSIGTGLYYSSCGRNIPTGTISMGMYGISPVYQVAGSSTLPGISITSGTTTTNEGDSWGLFINNSASQPVTVMYHVSQQGSYIDESELGFKTMSVSGSQQISIPTINDDTDESNGKIQVTLVPQNHYSISGSKYVSTTVNDDETKRVVFTSHGGGNHITVNLVEGDPAANISFKLTSDPQGIYSPTIVFPSKLDWISRLPEPDSNRISCYTGDGEGTISPLLNSSDRISYCHQNTHTHFEFASHSWDTAQTLSLKAGSDDDSQDHEYVIRFLADPSNPGYEFAPDTYYPDADSTITVRIADDDPPQNSPPPPSTSTVSLTATGNGSEGEDVTFGIESVPPPLTPLDVTVSLDQTGGILAQSNAGQRTITIPTVGFASLTIPTIDDGIIDKNTITITILDGNGYTVGVPSSNTITIPDNDVAIDGLIGLSDSVQEPETPQPEQPQPSFTADPTVVANIKEYAAETYRGQEHVDRWHRVLKTLGVEEFPGLTTMTSGEAYTFVQQGWNRWIPIVAELKVFEAWQEQQQPPQQEQQQPPQQEQQPIPVNLVSNGSFEAPIVTAHNGQWQQFAPSTTGISWTVTGDSLELQRGILGGASDGSQHAELDAQDSVTISQTLSTVSGQAYEISFDYKARPNTASNTNGMNVTWNGVDIAPNLTLGNTWQTHTVNATGTGSDTISFADAGTSDGIGTFLDNVSVMRTGSPPQ